MLSSYRSGLLLAESAISMAAPASAAARFPIIFGSGERETKIKELHADAKLRIPGVIHDDATICFRYTYFHLFFCDMWHWGGEYLLHEDDKYWRLTEAQWVELLGRSEFEALPKPFFYQVPFGLIIFGFFLITGPFIKRYIFVRIDRTTSLLHDARYQEALRQYREKLLSVKNSSSKDATDLEPFAQEDALATAVQYLEGEGVSPDQAKKHLIYLLSLAGIKVKPTPE